MEKTKRAKEKTVSGMSNVEEKVIFSTCLIGDRAKTGSELSFFTVPISQRMPMVPVDANRCEKCDQPTSRLLTEIDTNMMKAGELGSAFGDARFDKMRAQLEGGDPVVLKATVDLRIAGKTVLSTTLDELVAGWVQIEDEVSVVLGDGKRATTKTPFALVSRRDTVGARLRLTRDTKIAGPPVTVRLEIQALCGTDAGEGTAKGLAELVNAGRG
jgi:hypothetical protein